MNDELTRNLLRLTNEVLSLKQEIRELKANQSKPKPKWISTSELASELGVTSRTITKWIQADYFSHNAVVRKKRGKHYVYKMNREVSLKEADQIISGVRSEPVRVASSAVAEPGYVYVLRHQKSGVYKIGMTTQMVGRMKALRVEADTELVSKIKSKNPRRLESFLHARYKQQRLPQSEWFSLDHEPDLLTHAEELEKSVS